MKPLLIKLTKHGIEHHEGAKTLPLHVACHCKAGKLDLFC